MSELELLKFAVQAGIGGVFFWLYWITNQRLTEQDQKHEADIKQLYELRIQELKLMARLPTDLEGPTSVKA